MVLELPIIVALHKAGEFAAIHVGNFAGFLLVDLRALRPAVAAGCVLRAVLQLQPLYPLLGEISPFFYLRPARFLQPAKKIGNLLLVFGRLRDCEHAAIQ